MSTEQDKFTHSRRRLKDDNAVKKQTKIAKEFGLPVDEPHKFVKRHAMNCGNPRKVFNEPTQQEKRLFQDLDQIRGTPPAETEQ